MKGRVVAFDPGDRRIGVAVSDPEGKIALPRPTIQRSGESWPWRALLEVIREAEATRLVVGDPIHLDGSTGARSRISHELADELARRTGLPVDLQDERLTSVQATRALGESRGSRGKSVDVDRAAAILILQAWLDRHARDEG
ncbi:MAG: Holliday junction resolvase RuvX [bacterium]